MTSYWRRRRRHIFHKFKFCEVCLLLNERLCCSSRICNVMLMVEISGVFIQTAEAGTDWSLKRPKLILIIPELLKGSPRLQNTGSVQKGFSDTHVRETNLKLAFKKRIDQVFKHAVRISLSNEIVDLNSPPIVMLNYMWKTEMTSFLNKSFQLKLHWLQLNASGCLKIARYNTWNITYRPFHIYCD